VSPSAYITRRMTGSGPRYVVRYRMGGRAFRLHHAGSFKTIRDARARRDFIAGELAAGRDPRAALERFGTERPTRTLRQWTEAYIASRIDHKPATLRTITAHKGRIVAAFGDRPADEITTSDVREWIAAEAKELKPSSLLRYVGTLRLILDFAGVEPNPARDRSVKLPAVEQAVIEPPSSAEVRKMIAAAPQRWRLPLVVLDETGMRVGEIAELEWRDVDIDGSRFRVRSGKTRAARRWVAVPESVMLLLIDSCPPDDRAAERHVFPGFNPALARYIMRRACESAGLAHLHPHDLRHRYVSRKLVDGVPLTDLAAQVGHSRSSFTLDRYAHVLASEETPEGSA
jgi:integrase